MTDSDKTVKHFIVVRFFPWQHPQYPHDVFDVDFLSRQLPLTKNLLSSLENQSNKNFELVFWMRPIFLKDKKYDFIFSTLRDSTTLPLTFITDGFMRPGTKMLKVVNDALNEYDFVIQTKIDFDDFVYKDAVADTQSKINHCNSILIYGYCKGYSYFSDYGELYPYCSLWNGIGHHSIMQSVILKSSFAKKMSSMCGSYTFFHDQAKPMLQAFLEKNRLEFSESMFEQNTSTDAYIYFRSEFSLFNLRTTGNPTLKVPNRPPLTTNDITKKQLEDEFGFHYELKSIK